MCSKCDEIDSVIAHYRELELRVTDQQTLDGLARLIDKLEADKVALHPQCEENGE